MSTDKCLTLQERRGRK